MSIKQHIHLKIIILTILFISSSSPVYGSIKEIISNFHPYITIEEEYIDNLYLAPDDEQEDFITTLYPGINFSISEIDYAVDMDYRVGVVNYANETDNNYISHTGTLNTNLHLSDRTIFRLRDYIIRSQEPFENDYAGPEQSDQYPASIMRQRSTYTRNVFEPSMEYSFGPEDLLSLNYRNNIYRIQGDPLKDSEENFLSAGLAFWFNIKNGINIVCNYSTEDFRDSSDIIIHGANGCYTYRFGPASLMFIEYSYMNRDFKTSSDGYDINSVSSGVEKSLTEGVKVSLSAGYFSQNPKQGQAVSGGTYNVMVDGHFENISCAISLNGGYDEDYISSENLGFSRYHQANAQISYQLLETLTTGISGFFKRSDFDPDRKDKAWQLGWNLSYRLFIWAKISLDISHRENDSNDDIIDYRENKGILRLTAQF